MPDYNYIVRSEGGARKTGSISAKNYNEAIKLRIFDEAAKKDNIKIKKIEYYHF